MRKPRQRRINQVNSPRLQQQMLEPKHKPRKSLPQTSRSTYINVGPETHSWPRGRKFSITHHGALQGHPSHGVQSCTVPPSPPNGATQQSYVYTNNRVPLGPKSSGFHFYFTQFYYSKRSISNYLSSNKNSHLAPDFLLILSGIKKQNSYSCRSTFQNFFGG